MVSCYAVFIDFIQSFWFRRPFRFPRWFGYGSGFPRPDSDPTTQRREFRSRFKGPVMCKKVHWCAVAVERRKSWSVTLLRRNGHLDRLPPSLHSANPPFARSNPQVIFPKVIRQENATRCPTSSPIAPKVVTQSTLRRFFTNLATCEATPQTP